MSKIKRYIEEQMEMGIDLLADENYNEEYQEYLHNVNSTPPSLSGNYRIYNDTGDLLESVDDLSIAFYLVDNLKIQNGGNYHVVQV